MPLEVLEQWYYLLSLELLLLGPSVLGGPQRSGAPKSRSASLESARLSDFPDIYMAAQAARADAAAAHAAVYLAAAASIFPTAASFKAAEATSTATPSGPRAASLSSCSCCCCYCGFVCCCVLLPMWRQQVREGRQVSFRSSPLQAFQPEAPNVKRQTLNRITPPVSAARARLIAHTGPCYACADSTDQPHLNPHPQIQKVSFEPA